jgi:predicted DNA-binding protein (MmcQ/YjbR family)
MVKNTKGGSGHKSQARKFSKPATNAKLRLSEDPNEMYAVITKRLGGEFCHVKCHDDKTRLCIIRGKFRGGGGKRDNFVNRDSWVLVGLRDWESFNETKDKLQKCDLLEVYKDTDKIKLRNIPNINWSLLAEQSAAGSSVAEGGGDIVFSDNYSEEEYK